MGFAAMIVRVTYPVTQGQLVLRTDMDWERNLFPVRIDGDTATFELAATAHFHALKPVLVDGAKVHWAKGPNVVVSQYEPLRELLPFFFADERGRISDVERVSHDGTTLAFRIYYPAGYDENRLRSFPVLYMQDGNNLFFPEEAFSGNEWRVDETMDRLDQMSAIRKTVVVGIAPADRMRDYTKPGYESYGRFLAEQLKPRIDAKVRTRKGPEDTAVMGSSLGGVAALYLAWQYPHLFGRAGCLSSTFGLMDDLFERISVEPKRDIAIYLDSGWPRDNFDNTNAMRDLLMQRGYRLGVDLLQFSFPEGVHNEQSWAARLHLPFQFFFGRAWSAQRAGDGAQR
jgi:predicted alpha/beta superfamily hydrolase